MMACLDIQMEMRQHELGCRFTCCGTTISIAATAAAAPAAAAVTVFIAMPPWLVSPLCPGSHYVLTACGDLLNELEQL